MTDERTQRLADLVRKKVVDKLQLTIDEQNQLDELRAEYSRQVSPAEIERMREAARQTANLIGCGLTLEDLAFHRDILDRRARGDVSITPEEMLKFEDVCSRIERCLRGGGNPPGGGSDPDDSGPDITDALGVQPVEDDEEEDKPPTALPVEEPVPVPVPVKDKDQKKAKPRTPGPAKRSGVDFP
jgi:hypothetical protein